MPRERGSCKSNRLRLSRPAAGPFPAVGRKGGPGPRHRLEQSTGEPGRGPEGVTQGGPSGLPVTSQAHRVAGAQRGFDHRPDRSCKGFYPRTGALLNA